MKKILFVTFLIVFTITFHLYPQIRTYNKISFPSFYSDIQSSQQANLKLGQGLSPNSVLINLPLNKITGNGYLKLVTLRQVWVDSNWVNGWRDSLVYDGNNNEIKGLRQYWDDHYSKWVNSSLWSYTYDGNKRTSYMWQDWQSSDWENVFLITSSYDLSNNLINDSVHSWDGSWVNDELYTYYYDDNNNRIASLFQQLVYSNWCNITFESYTYDANKNMTQYLEQDWDGSKWDNVTKDSFIYNTDNNLISDLCQYWNDSTWVNDSRKSYTFNGIHQKTEYLYQKWDNKQWINSGRLLYNYDENNNNTEQTRQRWDGFYWVNEYMSSLTYDGNNYITESLDSYWADLQWVVYHRVSYTYIPLTGITVKNVAPKVFVLHQNYPNPFNPSTTIRYSLASESKVIIKVYNLLGQEIKTLVNAMQIAGNHQVTFNAGGLPSGMYLYRIQAGDFIQTKKMILLK